MSNKFKPEVCPVCEGTQVKSISFYERPRVLYSQYSKEVVRCHTCHGTGYILVEQPPVDLQKELTRNYSNISAIRENEANANKSEESFLNYLSIRKYGDFVEAELKVWQPQLGARGVTKEDAMDNLMEKIRCHLEAHAIEVDCT